MEPDSLKDEGPRLRPEARSAFPWIAAALALGLAGGIAYFYFQAGRPVPPAPIAKSETPPAPQPAEPAIRNPLPEAPAKSLPTLDNSDSMMRESLVQLLGRKAFADFFIPARLVRHIVATVDNLPRRAAPRRVMPLNGVPGAFATTGAGETLALDAANAARYAAHVSALEALPARALVALYVEAYPLFQRAYEELGYPGRYFNDRLLEAIDDLLAAPEADGAVPLVRPKVLYEFADPQLETRSAGQKILVRMGTDNARKVKARLRDIRRELAAAGERKP